MPSRESCETNNIPEKCSPSFESSRPKVGKVHALMHQRGKQWKKVSAQATHKLSCKWESMGFTSPEHSGMDKCHTARR